MNDWGAGGAMNDWEAAAWRAQRDRDDAQAALLRSQAERRRADRERDEAMKRGKALIEAALEVLAHVRVVPFEEEVDGELVKRVLTKALKDAGVKP